MCTLLFIKILYVQKHDLLVAKRLHMHNRVGWDWNWDKSAPEICYIPFKSNENRFNKFFDPVTASWLATSFWVIHYIRVNKPFSLNFMGVNSGRILLRFQKYKLTLVIKCGGPLCSKEILYSGITFLGAFCHQAYIFKIFWKILLPLIPMKSILGKKCVDLYIVVHEPICCDKQCFGVQKYFLLFSVLMQSMLQISGVLSLKM
jgi:hypothetical protein